MYSLLPPLRLIQKWGTRILRKKRFLLFFAEKCRRWSRSSSQCLPKWRRHESWNLYTSSFGIGCKPNSKRGTRKDLPSAPQLSIGCYIHSVECKLPDRISSDWTSWIWQNCYSVPTAMGKKSGWYWWQLSRSWLEKWNNRWISCSHCPMSITSTNTDGAPKILAASKSRTCKSHKNVLWYCVRGSWHSYDGFHQKYWNQHIGKKNQETDTLGWIRGRSYLLISRVLHHGSNVKKLQRSNSLENSTRRYHAAPRVPQSISRHESDQRITHLEAQIASMRANSLKTSCTTAHNSKRSQSRASHTLLQLSGNSPATLPLPAHMRLDGIETAILSIQSIMVGSGGGWLGSRPWSNMVAKALTCWA